MAKKPGIPSVSIQDQTLSGVVSALKENIEIITGARIGVGEISSLGVPATNDQIVAKLNEVIRRLNVSGN